MKTSSIIGLFAVAGAVLFGSCNSIAEKTETINANSTIVDRTYVVGNFRSIETSTVVNFRISQGNTTRLSLQAPANLIENITVEVKDGVLRVGAKKGKQFRNTGDRLVMTVTVPTLDAVTTSGTGDMKFIGKFTAGNFTAVSSGTGDIEMPQFSADKLSITSSGTGDVDFNGFAESADITSSGSGDVEFNASNCGRLVCSTSGTGDIELKGSAESAELNSYGTGDIEARRLDAKSVTATSAGTGKIECHASESFSGSAGGTGKIEVYGNPAQRVAETKRIKYMNR